MEACCLVCHVPVEAMDKRHFQGAVAEAIAAQYLQLSGIVVLQRNVSCAGVEVDLVAREGSRLLIVEVKLRKRQIGFDALQSLGVQQRDRLRRAATWMLAQCTWATCVRIDVIGLTWEPRDYRLSLEHLRGID